MEQQDDDRLQETRHALKNRLAVIRGWWQMVEREDGKLAPDRVRRDRYIAHLNHALNEMDAALDRDLRGGEAADGPLAE